MVTAGRSCYNSDIPGFSRIEVIPLQSPSPSAVRNEIAGNTCTGIVKIAAVFFMLIDHSAILFFKNSPFYMEMRLFGRIALPLFAWGCTVGCVYTRSILRYALRVFAGGFVFQWLYMPVMNHGWTYLNIFFPLSLGIMAVGGIRLGKGPVRLLIPALCLLVPDIVQDLTGASMDYTWKPVLLIICLYLARGDRVLLSLVFFVFCLFWGATSAQVNSFFGISLDFVNRSSLFRSFLHLQGCAVLALPFILWRPSFSFRIPKWLSYLIYPAHLALLWGIGQILA